MLDKETLALKLKVEVFTPMGSFSSFLPKNDNCMVIDDLRDTLDHGGEECLDHS